VHVATVKVAQQILRASRISSARAAEVAVFNGMGLDEKSVEAFV
jgi:hypothetical protein